MEGRAVEAEGRTARLGVDVSELCLPPLLECVVELEVVESRCLFAEEDPVVRVDSLRSAREEVVLISDTSEMRLCAGEWEPSAL